MKRYWRRFKSNKLAQLGLLFLLLVAIVAIFAPFIAPYDPAKTNYGALFNSPSPAHLFGTDSLGRDIFSRIVFGARTSLAISVVIALLQATVGVVLGLVSGVSGGWVDLLIQRLVEVQVTFPRVIGAMIIISVLGGSSVYNVILGLTLVGWAAATRLVRGEVLSIREEDYIQAARSIGVNTLRLYLWYYFVNVLPVVIVFITINVAFNILSIATLSFLGYGLPSSVPGWGVMLQDAQSINILRSKPWIWLPPGIAISLSVISINFVGDGLRDALDPKYYQKSQ